MTNQAAAVHRQVKASEVEAGFSLLCTLAVCIHQEWGQWDQVGAAIAIPIAMAFSVHGANNATGLGPWNWVYLPTRTTVIVLGVAYSYQHYYHFLPTLQVGGVDIKPAVAVIMELLTLSALIAHQAHTARLINLDEGTPPARATGPNGRGDREPVAGIDPSDQPSDDADPPVLPGVPVGALVAQPGIGLALNGAGNNSNQIN